MTRSNDNDNDNGKDNIAVPLFFFLWLMVGFSTGTSMLMGPVRWTVEMLHRSDRFWGTEDWVVRALIVVFVLGSAAVALWFTRLTLRTPHRHVRLGVPALAVLSATGSFWLWVTLGLTTSLGGEVRLGRRFTFGTYPSEERLQSLKADGYTTVISLLHPAIPFEIKLLSDEKAAAARVGLEFIHLPMLPWVSGNKESLEGMREILRRTSGRYYVHCYMGEHRVLVLRRMVEQAEPFARIKRERIPSPLETVKSFERGEIYRLDDEVYLTPYPTDQEFLFIVAGPVRQIVSLLDPASPEALLLIEKERLLLSQYGLAFRLMPLPSSYDPYKVLSAVREVRKLPRPVLVHDFFSPSTGHAPNAEAFIQAFRSNLPPLPPSLFADAGNPGVRVIAPHIALGPSPAAPEFLEFLYDRGVRELVFLGDSQPANEERERILDARAKSRSQSFRWRAVRSVDAGFLRELERGGPWYLYGSSLRTFEERIVKRFGPAVPDKVIWTPPLLTRLFEQVIPNPRTIILLGPILLLCTSAAASFVAWLHGKRQVRTPYTRKVFHFLIFTLAGVLQLLGGLQTVILFAAIASMVVFYALFRGQGFAFYEALARPTDEPHRTLFVFIPWLTTALGGLVTNLLFGQWAYIGYLVSGWGDAAGEPIGSAWGKHRYSVPSLAGVAATRSIEGSGAVLLFGIAAAFGGMLAGGVGPLTALKAAMICGLAGAAVESFSNHGLDNFTIQVVASGVAYWFLT